MATGQTAETALAIRGILDRIGSLDREDVEAVMQAAFRRERGGPSEGDVPVSAAEMREVLQFFNIMERFQ